MSTEVLDRPREAETLLRQSAALAIIRLLAATPGDPAEQVTRMGRVAEAALTRTLVKLPTRHQARRS